MEAKNKGDYYIIQGIIETENPDLKNKIKVDNDLITVGQVAMLMELTFNTELDSFARVFLNFISFCFQV